MFELLTGHLPFYAEERKMMFWLILKEKTRYPRHVSGESREIISKLLVKNPDRRLGSVADAEEVMEQPFFAVMDWNDLRRKRVTPPFNPVFESLVLLGIKEFISGLGVSASILKMPEQKLHKVMKRNHSSQTRCEPWRSRRPCSPTR